MTQGWRAHTGEFNVGGTASAQSGSELWERHGLLLSVSLMHSHPSRFDDPKLVAEWIRIEDGEEILQPMPHRVRRRVRRKLENHNSARLVRRKPQDVAEVMVQRDQGAALRPAMLEDHAVGLTAQILRQDRRDIMPSRSEELPAAGPDTLVQLELHPARLSVGTEMNRSRAASAP